MNESVKDSKAFITTELQQQALGLPIVPTAYQPHDFVKLAGRADLAHYMHKERAEAEKRSRRIDEKMQAGVAESVLVGILNKVVELGDDYDAAISVPRTLESAENEGNPTIEFTETFSPMLLEHFSMAASRRIEEVRAAQRADAYYAQMSAPQTNA